MGSCGKTVGVNTVDLQIIALFYILHKVTTFLERGF